MRDSLFSAVYLVSLAYSLNCSAAEFVADPWVHAEADSIIHAEGDTNNPGGWDGCLYMEESTEQNPKIQCRGERTILFHGGEDITVQFECNYEYKFVDSVKGYEVLDLYCI